MGYDGVLLLSFHELRAFRCNIDHEFFSFSPSPLRISFKACYKSDALNQMTYGSNWYSHWKYRSGLSILFYQDNVVKSDDVIFVSPRI